MKTAQKGEGRDIGRQGGRATGRSVVDGTSGAGEAVTMDPLSERGLEDLHESFMICLIR